MAVVVTLKKQQHVLARPLGIKTNNQAEYIALVVGIKHAHQLGANGLEVYTDSKLIVMQMQNQWYVRERTLFDLRHQARALLDALFENNWELNWIPRAKNEVADGYCTEAIRCNNPWLPSFNDPYRKPRLGGRLVLPPRGYVADSVLYRQAS